MVGCFLLSAQVASKTFKADHFPAGHRDEPGEQADVQVLAEKADRAVGEQVEVPSRMFPPPSMPRSAGSGTKRTVNVLIGFWVAGAVIALGLPDWVEGLIHKHRRDNAP